MKRTNHQIFDFLDIDTDWKEDECIWKAGKPEEITEKGGDIEIQLPFTRQVRSNDIAPDIDTPPQLFSLWIRAYEPGMLRIGIAFEGEAFPDSEMLSWHEDVAHIPLSFKKTEEAWLITDDNGGLRTSVNLRVPETDHWSDLVPGPQDSLDISLYPEGESEIRINAYDQFFPARQDAFAMAFIERKGEPHRSTISFHCEADEVFTGSGERFTKLDLSGSTVQLRNQDGQGVNNRRTYKNIPFYLSSRNYGVFMHTSSFGKISFADHSSRSVQLLSEEPLMDLFLIGGHAPETILYRYRMVTGFPAIPPLWSFGTWMSRMTYFSADEVMEICDRLRSEEFPCDVIHLDTGWFRTDWLCEWKFNEERFPDPEGFMSALRKKGFRVSLWQMPYIAREAEQHDEAVRNNYIGKVRKSDRGSDSNFSLHDYAGTIDLSNPEAVNWYKGLLRDLLEKGAVCIKTDFGEEIHQDAEYHGMSPEKLNNLYALLYQKAACEITAEVTGEEIIWARAGWAGCQRYPLHWGGDAACTWDGMAGTLKGGLHLGLSGFGFWSHDVPGFHSLPDFMNSVVPDDLYVRWTQFGVFTSHIRYHGTSKREPYHYPNIADIVRKWLRLRYALLPYILAQAIKTTLTGYPMLRAMILQHPEDKTCWHIDNQYYFGDHFLVAPVMNSENKRDIYLPEGRWIHFFTGEQKEGPVWLKGYESALGDMPVWVRPGVEIPFFPDKINSTDEYDPEKHIILKVDKDFKGIWNTETGRALL